MGPMLETLLSRNGGRARVPVPRSYNPYGESDDEWDDEDELDDDRLYGSDDDDSEEDDEDEPEYCEDCEIDFATVRVLLRSLFR